MKKLIIFWIAVFTVSFLVSTPNVFAQVVGTACNTTVANPCGTNTGLTCIVTNSASAPTVGTCQNQDINITAPTQGYSDLGRFITNILQIAFIFAVITVLFMLIWGAFEWITSGGDKEAVGHARGRIINALIGLAVLAIAFALFKVAGQFLGFDTTSFSIPKPRP